MRKIKENLVWAIKGRFGAVIRNMGVMARLTLDASTQSEREGTIFDLLSLAMSVDYYIGATEKWRLTLTATKHASKTRFCTKGRPRSAETDKNVHGPKK